MGAVLQLNILLSVSLIGNLAYAVEYQADAPVLAVEPVTETRYEPETRRVCVEPDSRAREFRVVAASIGEDMRQQARQWQQQQHCRDVTEQRAHEQVVGYRVTYRYGGEIETTRLSYDPGEHIPVTVSLSPLH